MLPDSDKLISAKNENKPEITFYPFMRLPPELRVMIWNLIMPAQRVVRIRDAKDLDPKADFIVPAPWQLPVVDLKVVQEIPAILLVNIESRKEGLKFYTSPFYSRLQHPILFDFSRDFLVFDGHSPCIDFLSFFYHWFERSHYTRHPGRIDEWGTIQDKMRNLIIGNSQKVRFRDWTFTVLASFSQLKLLGSPSSTDYFLPTTPIWPVDKVRYPPPGPVWRTLHKLWAEKKAGKGKDLSTMSRLEVRQYWAAMVEDNWHYVDYIWSTPSFREALGVESREDLMYEEVWKAKTPWPTDTDICFFDDDELQDFLLEFETREI